MTKAKPLIKWAGGKYRLAEQILPIIESELKLETFDTYVEPFLGGGGMLFAMTNRHSFSEVIASDINGELINMYVQVRDSVSKVIAELKNIETFYNSLPDETARKDFYLKLREEYNIHIAESRRNERGAALLIALNKLCFNGLYRVNQSGLFNVPFGKKPKAVLADYDNVVNVSEKIKNFRFIEGSFESSLVFASPKTFYYFDSPYRPLSKTEAFTSYAKSSFNDDSQRTLASMTEALLKKGAHFALSNSDPMQSETPDRFFINLYQHATVKTVNAQRNIGASSSSRKTISEILVIR